MGSGVGGQGAQKPRLEMADQVLELAHQAGEGRSRVGGGRAGMGRGSGGVEGRHWARSGGEAVGGGWGDW